MINKKKSFRNYITNGPYHQYVYVCIYLHTYVYIYISFIDTTLICSLLGSSGSVMVSKLD